MTVYLNFGYYPMWKRGGLCFHENGGRQPHECLDATVNIWKFSFGLTIYDLGWLSHVTRMIPRKRNGRGFSFGIFPQGKA